MLARLIRKDRVSWNSSLRQPIEVLLETFIFDAKRRNKPISQADLDWYSEAMGVSFIQALEVFYRGERTRSYEDLAPIARAACMAFILRDLVEDQKLGYINVPVEFWLSGRVTQGETDRWIKHEVKRACSEFVYAFEFAGSLLGFERLMYLMFLMPRYEIVRHLAKCNQQTRIHLSFRSRVRTLVCAVLGTISQGYLSSFIHEMECENSG